MERHYTRLELLVLEKYGTYQKCADDLGTTRMTLFNKLKRRYEWKRNDIVSMCDKLGIDKADVFDYFFAD